VDTLYIVTTADLFATTTDIVATAAITTTAAAGAAATGLAASTITVLKYVGTGAVVITTASVTIRRVVEAFRQLRS